MTRRQSCIGTPLSPSCARDYAAKWVQSLKIKGMRMGTSFELAGGGRSFAHSRSGGTFACWGEGDPCVYMKYIMGIVVDSWYRPATVGSESVFPSQTKNMCCDFQNETERGCRLNMI